MSFMGSSIFKAGFHFIKSIAMTYWCPICLSFIQSCPVSLLIWFLDEKSPGTEEATSVVRCLSSHRQAQLIPISAIVSYHKTLQRTQQSFIARKITLGKVTPISKLSCRSSKNGLKDTLISRPTHSCSPKSFWAPLWLKNTLCVGSPTGYVQIPDRHLHFQHKEQRQ